ncbi:MAG: hypothetical protein JWQ27_248 [Ferruginibacter sp.]|nr:hypothetical protein [Ferruginibacter sp.]
MTTSYKKYFFNPYLTDTHKVNEETILKAFNTADYQQKINDNFFLYFKQCADPHLRYLLLGVFIDKDEISFAFAFWVPSNLFSEDLLITLINFTTQFGCEIQIGNEKGSFVEKATLFKSTPPREPADMMEILGSIYIDCVSFIFHSTNHIGGQFEITCYCSFAISISKYFAWLYAVPMITIPVRTGWENLFSELLKIVDPLKRTPFKILTPKVEKKSFAEENNVNDTIASSSQIIIPAIYEKPFAYLNERILNLSEGEKILVLPVAHPSKCIFCDSNDLSKEHIFPQWLRNFFKEKFIQPTLLSKFGDEDFQSSLLTGVSDKPESSYGFVNHQVCKACNSNWMSTLESRVKDVLSQDDKHLHNSIDDLKLSLDKNSILSHWVIVKVLLLSIKQNMVPLLPENTFENLVKGVLPKDVIIEIAECKQYDINFILGDSLVDHLRLTNLAKEKALELIESGWCYSLQIGHFLFRVSYLKENLCLSRKASVISTTVIFPPASNIINLEYPEIYKEWMEIKNHTLLYLFNFSLVVDG